MKRFAFAALFAIAFAGCGESQVVDYSSGNGSNPNGPKGSKADSSAVAVFLDFEFDGELYTTSCWNPEQQVENQILYTVGQLNGDNSVGRLDRLVLTNVEKETSGSGCIVTYHAKIPVAWGKKNDVPERYTVKLPRDNSTAGIETFLEKYGHDCVASGAHDVTAGIFWYYFRPARFSCSLAAEDIVEVEANVFPSDIQTTGKYPEYHKIWEDGTFDVVAIFGKYEDGATSGDAGISAYNRFAKEIKEHLGPHAMVTEPTDIPFNPGVEMPEMYVEATLSGGRKVRVWSYLVDSVGTADSSFWNKYEELTPTADFIVYNGHAGLGANIRKLASKGKWRKGQYSIVFMNGCDTYAYVDSALADAHAEVNDDDETGTKHLDVVANAMPSFFRSMSGATMALLKGLMDYENPRTYEQLFKNIDSSEVVLVSGEHDNVYVPGMEIGGGTDEPTTDTPAWDGKTWTGEVAQDQEMFFETVVVPAGRYEIAMSGTGDADLYVRAGLAPNVDLYDCRPYKSGSDEVCEVVLGSAAPVHIMVRGYDPDSSFTVIGTPMQ